MQQRSIVICGPSGSGKSTLLKKLLAENKDQFAYTISHTTRKPRSGEEDGKQYHFVSRETMLQMIKAGEFIEHVEFSGNLYGTSKRAIQETLKSGKLLILEVDIEGVKALKKLDLDDFKPLFVFIKPPSHQVLVERLSKRGTETPEDLKRRLDRAIEEIKFAESGSIKFDLILVNDDLDKTYKDLKDSLI